MASFRCMNDDITNRDLTVCWKRSGLRVTELYEPRRDGWRREDRYIAGEAFERSEDRWSACA